MSDIFLDLFINRLRDLKIPQKEAEIEAEMRELPEPSEEEQAAVDGGGGQARLEGGLSIRVARGILIGEGLLEKDLDLEIDEWDSISSLESLRSFLELRLANSSDVLTFVDGSSYTQLSTWIMRIIKIASGKAKSSEIVSLPNTLNALSELLKLSKRETAFVAKEPKFRILKEVMIAERLSEVDSKDYIKALRDGPLDKKQLYETSLKYRNALGPLLSPSLLDSHLLKTEGLSKGIVLGLPKRLRSKLYSSEFKKVVRMAVEVYKLTTGRDVNIPKGLEEICYVKAPILWWVKYKRWKFTIEEFSGPPLCLAPYREVRNDVPKTLAAFLSQSGSSYHAWLSLAHSLSTMKGEHFMTYLNILKEQKGLGMNTAREELLYLS